MGYYYHDCYIDADTLAGQEEQMAECDRTRSERLRRLAAQAPKSRDELWQASPVNLTSEERKTKEAMIDAWRFSKSWERKQRLEKEQWEKEWAWAWGESYVYFIFDTVRNLVKIGVSSELPNRFNRLKSEHPNITLEGVILGNYQDEQEYHKIFSGFRVEGEWFEPVPPILHFIKHFTHTPHLTNRCSRLAQIKEVGYVLAK